MKRKGNILPCPLQLILPSIFLLPSPSKAYHFLSPSSPDSFLPFPIHSPSFLLLITAHCLCNLSFLPYSFSDCSLPIILPCPASLSSSSSHCSPLIASFLASLPMLSPCLIPLTVNSHTHFPLLSFPLATLEAVIPSGLLFPSSPLPLLGCRVIAGVGSILSCQ